MNGYGIIAPNTFGKITGAPEPICEPMDAIAEAVAWATCTSDPHQVHAGLPAGLILGHEVVARLVKVGSMVKDFKAGDIVCVGAVTPDWTWPNCQDNIHQDANGAAQGMNWCVTENGTFAERFRIRQVDCNATYIPKSLTYEHALMASDMVTTGFHGVEMAHVTWGDTVVVMGIGPVGLMSVAGSALRGAGRIIAIGRRPITLELAKEYGATDVLNYTDGPIDEQVLELTGNVLKRYEGRPNLLEGADFLLDRQTYTLYIHNQSVVLPPNQGKLLETLLAHGGQTVTKDDLSRALWGTTEFIDENALQVNLTRLKKTMASLGMRQQLVSVRGVGYRLEASK